MRSLWIAAILLLACVGADEGALGMAEEVNGECVFTPGSYVAEYEIADSSGCEGMEPLPDEFMTVTKSGQFTAASGGAASSNCVDRQPLVEGCAFRSIGRVAARPPRAASIFKQPGRSTTPRGPAL